ncbi:chitin deacetylase [Mortierella sp. GBA35]|nr:chitin deacetylase [Mortierella sp. GBA35]
MKSILSTMAIALMAAATATAQFNAASYPPPNAIPPVDTPQVKEWLAALNFADVPVYPKNSGAPPVCPAAATLPAGQCWRSCQNGCRRDEVVTCPTPGVWGITFDDGPTPNTPTLLKILKDANIKATFFVMGGNVVQNPEILKQEQTEGHHIASHTWSHSALTTLTNEQIVAELKWTEKAVMELTGLQMKYVRPPYGDIDDRVRAVCKKLGYTIVDWTSDEFDTKDFSLNAAPANLDAAVATFTASLNKYAAAPGAKGIITLEHDLYPVTVEMAKRLIPVGVQAKLKIQSIAECLNDAAPYQNAKPPATNNTNGTTGGNKPAGNGKGSNAGSVSAKVLMTVAVAVIAAGLSI